MLVELNEKELATIKKALSEAKQQVPATCILKFSKAELENSMENLDELSMYGDVDYDSQDYYVFVDNVSIARAKYWYENAYKGNEESWKWSLLSITAEGPRGTRVQILGDDDGHKEPDWTGGVKQKEALGEAYDAVTDRNNIKKQRQVNRSYLTHVMKRLKNALEEKGIDCTVKDYTVLKIGKYKVTLWNFTEEYADVKEFGKNYEGAESGDDASYSQMDSNVILRFWDTTHLSPDEKVFDVRNTPGMVQWILDNMER